MTEYVRAYSGADGNTLVSVPVAFAENAGLRTVKDAATGRNGRPLPPAEGYRRKSSASRTADEQETTNDGGAAASKPEEATK